ADPVPRNQEQQIEQETADLHWGVRTINEVRAVRGLPPVAWGETPWLPVNLAPPDFPNRDAIVEATGRGRLTPRQPAPSERHKPQAPARGRQVPSLALWAGVGASRRWRLGLVSGGRAVGLRLL